MAPSTLLILVAALHVYTQYTAAEEYCQLEAFEATCPPDHVILVTQAKYGRMKLGRCLTRDYYVGCSDDVTNILHQRCSGQTKCSVSIPDPALYEKQHCPKDLVSYLDAEYSCLQVTMFPNATCKNNKKDIFVRQDGGFIAGYQPTIVTGRSPLNTNCPLALRAPPGQKINITLYEFFNKDDSTLMAQQGQYQCIVLATVKEYMGKSFRENVICGSGGHRQELVYSSKTHEVTIEMSGRGEGAPRFLLQYQAIGCRDPAIPDDMTLQRRGDQLDVRCNNTGQVWHLVCRGNTWVGEFGNCTSDGGMYYDSDGGSKRILGFPNGIVMAIVVGIVLGIMIGFCLLLVVYNIRRKRRKAANSRGSADRNSGQPQNKYQDGTYNVNDPMLPSNNMHPDLTLDKGCHMITDVTGTMVRARDRDHVYEKPQSGMEIQCLLSQTKPLDATTVLAMDPGDYGCHFHSQKSWPQHGEKFEMMPPPPSFVMSS